MSCVMGQLYNIVFYRERHLDSKCRIVLYSGIKDTWIETRKNLPKNQKKNKKKSKHKPKSIQNLFKKSVSSTRSIQSTRFRVLTEGTDRQTLLYFYGYSDSQTESTESGVFSENIVRWHKADLRFSCHSCNFNIYFWFLYFYKLLCVFFSLFSVYSIVCILVFSVLCIFCMVYLLYCVILNFVFLVLSISSIFKSPYIAFYLFNVSVFCIQDM